jgi:soluble P-type ATPase
MSGPRDGVSDRGVVALDNSGTTSDVLVEVVGFLDDEDEDLAEPVPTVRVDRPVALVNVELADLAVLDADGSLAAVLAASGVPIHLALSNVETGAAAARRATLADDAAPARPLFDAARRLRERVVDEHGEEDPPIGVQLVVELEPGTIHRGFAYASVPRSDAASAVAAMRGRGFDVHLVSGDAAHVLESVAARVGVPVDNVHPYQSPEAKAETVSALRERDGGPVVMVGDYVNDRLAFERADRAVLLCTEAEPDADLARRVDAVAGSLSEVVTRL